MRHHVALLIAALFGVAACSDANTPQADSSLEAHVPKTDSNARERMQVVAPPRVVASNALPAAASRAPGGQEWLSKLYGSLERFRRETGSAVARMRREPWEQPETSALISLGVSSIIAAMMYLNPAIKERFVTALLWTLENEKRTAAVQTLLLAAVAGRYFLEWRGAFNEARPWYRINMGYAQYKLVKLSLFTLIALSTRAVSHEDMSSSFLTRIIAQNEMGYSVGMYFSLTYPFWFPVADYALAAVSARPGQRGGAAAGRRGAASPPSAGAGTPTP